MINLLPYDIRKLRYHEYRTRRTVVLVALLCILLAASTIVLVSMHVLLRSDANTIEASHRELADRLASGESSSVSREASDLKQKVDTILSFTELRSLSEIRNAVDKTVDEAVTIHIMQFVRTKDGGGTLTLSARVRDRKHVLLWEERLRAEPLFTGVSVPTANLIKNEDVDITLTFTVLPMTQTRTQ